MTRLTIAAYFLLIASVATAGKFDALVAQSSSADSEGRALEGYYNDNTWMVDYSIKFEGCSSILQFSEEGGDNRENQSKTRIQHLARYRLCKSGKCNSDCKGEYLVDLGTFVDAYTENLMNEREYNCEVTRENCNCQYANDDQSCENQCYVTAGQDYCIENQDQYEEEFEVQRYLECTEMNMNENNYQYNSNGERIQYFIGPKCSSNGKSVNLGVFTDETCSTPAPSGVYEKNNYYGKSLPYSKDSLVESNCVSCEQVDRNDQNNNNYNREVAEVCTNTYEASAKCEKGMSVSYPKTDDCDYITKTSVKQASSGGGGGAAVAFAWIFAISTVTLGAYSYKLYSEKSRGKVGLSEQGTGALA